jgi:predicted nuclease with TOPRIM domain
MMPRKKIVPFREKQHLPEIRRALVGNSREMFRKYEEAYEKLGEEEREVLRDLWMKRAGLSTEEFAKRVEVLKKRAKENPYERL